MGAELCGEDVGDGSIEFGGADVGEGLSEEGVGVQRLQGHSLLANELGN